MMMILAAGTTLAAFQRAMRLLEPIGERSALSMYAGKRLLEGKLPYRDVWYGGMPGTALCNGLAELGGWGRAGVLGLGIMFAVAAAWLVRARIKQTTGNAIDAGTGAALVLFSAMSVISIGGENSSYEWALPLQACFLFFIAKVEGVKGKQGAFFAGVSCGMAALFIPRELALAALGIWALKSNRVSFVGGMLLPLAAIGALLGMGGALADFSHQALDYRVVAGFSGSPGVGGGRIEILKAIGAMAPLLAALLLKSHSRAGEDAKVSRFGAMLAAWAIYELVVFAALGVGEAAGLLPAVVPLAALLCARVRPSEIEVGDWRARALMALALAGFMFSAVHVAGILPAGNTGGQERAHKDKLLPELANRVAGEKGTILVWGRSAETYLELGRGSGMKYPTIQPLFMKGYGEKLIPEHKAELRMKPPELLILEMSLLPEGIEENIAGDKSLWLGPAQKELLFLMQKMVREDYRILSAHEGRVFCVRKAAK